MTAGPQDRGRSDIRHAVKLVAAFAAIYLIWGSTYLGIRFAVETIPPLLMMGARNFLAGTLLYAWMRARGAPAPNRTQWSAALATGLLLFLADHGALAWAEQRVPSGLAALLSATLPFSMVLIARAVGREKELTGRMFIGLFLGIAGVALLIGPDALFHRGHADLVGCAAILIGTVFWSAGSIYGRVAKLPSSPALSAGMQMMAGGGALLCAGLLLGEAGEFHAAELSMRSLLALCYLILVGSIVAFTAYIWLLGVSTPARVATYAYVNPVVALVLGWALAGEPIGARTWVAAAIILAGVALVNSGPRSLARRDLERTEAPPREALRYAAPLPEGSPQEE
jgi:drug/metabolite transporter (DMT)-like permease